MIAEFSVDDLEVEDHLEVEDESEANDKEEIEVVSRLAMNIKDFPICAPLWQQIFEWFLENYKIEVQIHKYREDAYFLSINNTYLVDDLDFKLKFKKSEVKIKALEICLKRIKK